MTSIRTFLACHALALAAACQAAVPAAASAATATAAPARTLLAYADEAAFLAALARWRAAAPPPERRRELSLSDGAALSAAPAAAPAPMSSPQESKDARSESITNVQTAGVDEGGIVKRAGDHLVVLRRGRLFTVRIGGDALVPVAAVPAYGPDLDPGGTWYDELLVSGSTVVVIGYSYARGGTEIGLFELGRDGGLAYRATHHLRSFDYFASRNYASRLVGSRLVFYTPSYLSPGGPDEPADFMPAVRRWHAGATPAEFRRILPATRVYRTDDELDPRQPLALHTVTSCDLSNAALPCESSAVLGPAGRVFYVSASAVYVWTSPARPCAARAGAGCAASAVFRLPLDGDAPSALKTSGVPVDAMSFLEDDLGRLNVLVRETGSGEAMAGSERMRGRLALLRVPLAEFGDGRAAAQRSHYRALPGPASADLRNRFVGEWLLWGAGDASSAWAVRFRGYDEAQALAPGHAVERIEALGNAALLVGNAGGDLHFSSVRLGASEARIAARYVQAGARQGESRSHGFFYWPMSAAEGIVGLPMLGGGDPSVAGGWGRTTGSAAVLYLRARDLELTPLGRLDARRSRPADDGCVASCVDWYGNARPIFIGERVFALLGYELVEGRIARPVLGAPVLAERRRIGFAPASLGIARATPFN